MLPIFLVYFHKRFPELYINFKGELPKLDYYKKIKRYLVAIKDKDWEYVKYRTIIFIGTWIIVAFLVALGVILLVGMIDI